MSKQRETLTATAPWKEGLETVTVHTTFGTIKKNFEELHVRAKAGDVEAAEELVSASAVGSLFRLTEEQIRELEENGITNEQLREFGIADNTEGLTRSETRQILLLANTGGNSSSSRRFTANDREAKGTETPREGAAGQVTVKGMVDLFMLG